MARVGIVEERKIIRTQDAIEDTRSAGDKWAERIGHPFFFSASLAALIALMVAFPVVFLPIGLFAVPSLIRAHRKNQPILFFRYPKTHVNPRGSAGDGILFLGNIESDSRFDDFKEIWESDSDARMHFLILGSTGSGKSETLKGILYNALTWSSGYFVADGKADNKLPTDNYALARSFARDDDVLVLNFLLGGTTPRQIQTSRRRRTNRFNPFPGADADTIIQMGTNLLPKAEGEGKIWLEKAISLWRAVVTTLAYKRDSEGLEISVSTFIEYLSLAKIEELYLDGYRDYQQRGVWWYGYERIKNYLSGELPGYQLEKLHAKYGLPPIGAGAGNMLGGMRGRAGAMPPGNNEQDTEVHTQHGYRVNQLMPALNLLDGTYRHIFGYKRTEIDMIDVALNNRILMMLIPSLEKSAQEAENLGKLAIASLRVMMGKNLGAEVEGRREDLIDAKATNSPYPYIVALDELGYYFADGIAVMNAQARSLGFCMIALAQDVEKLTEGSRASEANAMMANEVSKLFLRVDDVNKSGEMISKMIPKAPVAMRHDFERGEFGWNRASSVTVKDVDRITADALRSFEAGQGVFVAPGGTYQMRTFYMGEYLEKYKINEFWINRFVQVLKPDEREVKALSTPRTEVGAMRLDNAQRMLRGLRYESDMTMGIAPDSVISRLASLADRIPRNVGPAERAIALYMAARDQILVERPPVAVGAQTQAPPGQPRQHAERPPGAGVQSPEDAGTIDPHVAAAQSMAVDPDDPLAFLTVPFERKPIEQVFRDLPGGEKAALEPRSDPMRAVAAVEIDSIGLATGATPEPERPNASPQHKAVAMADLVEDAYGGSLTTDVPAQAPSESGALPGGESTAEPPEADIEDASWIRLALQQSRAQAGAAMQRHKMSAQDPPSGGDAQGAVEVIGLTGRSMSSAAELEIVLGASRDEAVESVHAIEQVVSTKVTPDEPSNEATADAALRIHELLNAFRERR